jgi:hypothetical protein
LDAPTTQVVGVFSSEVPAKRLFIQGMKQEMDVFELIDAQKSQINSTQLRGVYLTSLFFYVSDPPWTVKKELSR